MQDKASGQVDDFCAALSMQAEYNPTTPATRSQVHAASLARTDARGLRHCDVSETGTAQSSR
jgi:hypothetical protein